MAKKWIQGAKLKKGSFTRQAKAAGMSVPAFAAKVTKPGSGASALTKRRGQLAKTFERRSK